MRITKTSRNVFFFFFGSRRILYASCCTWRARDTTYRVHARWVFGSRERARFEPRRNSFENTPRRNESLDGGGKQKKIAFSVIKPRSSIGIIHGFRETRFTGVVRAKRGRSRNASVGKAMTKQGLLLYAILILSTLCIIPTRRKPKFDTAEQGRAPTHRPDGGDTLPILFFPPYLCRRFCSRFSFSRPKARRDG